MLVASSGNTVYSIFLVSPTNNSILGSVGFISDTSTTLSPTVTFIILVILAFSVVTLIMVEPGLIPTTFPSYTVTILVLPLSQTMFL